MPAKLYFRYGVMNSGKSLFLLSTSHNFVERGVPHLILKSAVDVRDKCIKSRALNVEKECVVVDSHTDVFRLIQFENQKEHLKWILVDEAQFMEPAQIDQLAKVVDELQINVICYGLRTDFKTQMFPGSARLFEVADKFEELKSTCQCGHKASVNARIDSEGYVVTEGEQIECGSEDKYITLCRNCYNIATSYHLKVSEIQDI